VTAPSRVDDVRIRPRRRISLGLAVLCVVALTSCGFRDDPTPRHTMEPGLTTSDEGQKPAKRAVCDLITADERTALAGETMNAVVPVSSPVTASQECRWVHSLNSASTSVIRLVAFGTKDWLKVAGPQLDQAMRNPKISLRTFKRLQAAQKRISEGSSNLTTQQICDLYWVLARANGFKKGSQVVFSSMIGRARAAYNIGCSDGVLTMLGYGEYGLTTSISLYQAIIELRQKVHERAAKEFGDLKDTDGEGDDSASDSPSDDPSASETSSPEPTSSASPTDSSGADDSE